MDSWEGITPCIRPEAVQESDIASTKPNPSPDKPSVVLLVLAYSLHQMRTRHIRLTCDTRHTGHKSLLESGRKPELPL